MNNKNEYRLMCRWLAVGVFGGAALASIALSGEIIRALYAFATSEPGIMLCAIGAAFYSAYYLAREGSR